MCFFCYVDDFVEGIVCLFKSDYVFLVNVGNLDEIIIGEFVEEIIKLIGIMQKVIYKEFLVDDLKQCQLDIIKVCEILGWEFVIGCLEGLKWIYDYFKSFLFEELNEKEYIDFESYIK